MKRLFLLLCIITLSCFFACITGCELQSVVPSENGNNQAVVPDPSTDDPVTPDPVNPDPVNPDPVNPDPVNPDPVNPDPVNPDPVNPDPITPDPIPQVETYVINGKLENCDKYGLKSKDIVATASNGNAVIVNDDYTYSVKAEEGSLTLSFSAKGFESLGDSFYVSSSAVKNYAFSQPELTTYTTSFNKVGDVSYKVNIDNGTPYNSAVFESVSTDYFVIESDVYIKNTGSSTDFGVGFVVGGCKLSSQYYAPHIGTDCGILISKTGSAKWKVEMVYFDENGSNIRDKVNASFDYYSYMHPIWKSETATDVSSEMDSALSSGGKVHIKAVRADKIIALFVNDKYVGGFMTAQYEGQKIASASSEDYIGLYERGGIECIFDNVSFDARESVAKTQIQKTDPKKCSTCTMQTWGGFELTDGQTKVSANNATLKNVVSASSIANNSGIVAAGISNVNSKYWVLEAKISDVISHNDWKGFYIGFMVNGWSTSCLNMCYVPGENCFCIESVSGAPWTYGFVPDKNYTRAVSLKDKYTALMNGGSLVYKIVRAGDDFYVFIDGKLVTSLTIGEKLVNNETNTYFIAQDSETVHPSSNSIGFTARAWTQATFSNISYYTDGIAVYNELQKIGK